MSSASIRLPAEWEQQDAILLAWPTADSDWSENLAAIEAVYLQLVTTISNYETVLLICREQERDQGCERVRALLEQAGAITGNVVFYSLPINDTWLRDSGPIGVIRHNKARLYDFGFNGWGLKFRADLDNQINRQLDRLQAFSCPLETTGLILEGGSIESDGNGLLLTTSRCLLSPNRNPHLTEYQLEELFASLFGTTKVLWLDHGYLSGDDTDSHIDTLARLCPNNRIVYSACADKTDEHYDDLKKMERQLRDFTTIDGQPFQLFPLPWPQAKFDRCGCRLPATYANFLIINDAVLVPTYADPADDAALRTIQQLFPERDIIGINCNAVIEQHGSLHCLTMQLTQGAIS